jgi:hypothetical protein
MTQDKIKLYIGERIFNHIAELDKNSLLKMRDALLTEMELYKPKTKQHFLYTVELNFINYRIGN